MASCEEDLTKNNSKQSKNFASQIINNAYIIQRDSGFISMKAKAPIIEKYELIDSPYTVARKGIDIQFFDKKKPKIPGTIKAKYARFYDYKKFYEARGNVRITTNEGDKFAMQSVYWDQIKKSIYTRDTVYVTRKDGSTLIGAHGMRAKDDFSEYVFFQNSGDFAAPEISPKQKIAMVFHAIGLMSGTSLDGLDICLARFEKLYDWSFRILKAETLPYSAEWESKLRNSIFLSAGELLELHSEYGFYLGKSVKGFIEKHQLTGIDLIASHGHTVFHQPHKKFTLQIGDGRAIKLETNLPVIYDFRSQDVLMGGNGAPLVPIGDSLLFPQYDACINLGGFSNISLTRNHKRIAFDIAPVNIILNTLAQQFNKNFDENGDLAGAGEINEPLLKELNSLPFYRQSPPKSLGIEWCNEHIFPRFKDVKALDLLATLTEHAAVQISEVLNENQLKKVLFTGGGTYNSYLIQKIKSKTNTETIIPGKDIIDYKEALIFAFMGVLRLNNEINVLASATGSSQDHCSGIIA